MTDKNIRHFIKTFSQSVKTYFSLKKSILVHLENIFVLTTKFLERFGN